MKTTGSPVIAFACLLAILGWGGNSFAQPDSSLQPKGSSAPESPQSLEQLVVPIALYPDGLLSQVLAAATFPVQIVEADRWLHENAGLSNDQLAAEADRQPWDPGVKALIEFPSVLDSLDKNLSWTSALGDAYFNQPQDVMNAVQEMRRRAQDAGNLKSTSQMAVASEGPDITIGPTDPDVVYVPTYNPWIVYGEPIPVFPGFFLGADIGVPVISFGFRVPIGPVFGRYGWGWHRWGVNWGRRAIVYNRSDYVSRSRTFVDHGSRGAAFSRAREGPRPDFASKRSVRGFQRPEGGPSSRSNAFSGFDHGGTVRSYSARGRSSAGAARPSGGAAGGGHHR